MSSTNTLIYPQESFAIRGAIYQVYNTLGCGLLEDIYHEALLIELATRKIPFETEKLIKIKYRGIELRQFYKADLVCYDKIILELKAVNQLLPEHRAQTINYLHLTGYKLALLINFNSYPSIEIERFINDCSS